MALTYTFQQLYTFYLKSNPHPEFKSLEEYTEAYRKAYKIKSKTEVSFDNNFKPISK